MASKDSSSRIKEQRRVLDEAGRKRRARKALEALEQDNYHEDPHANLVMSKKAPKFDEGLDGRNSKDGSGGTKKRKTRSSEYFKQKYRRNFPLLIEEEQLNNPKGPNYITATAPPSKKPERKLCAVCGFPAPYTCVSCGARYCTVRCFGTHQDTRCLKFTA